MAGYDRVASIDSDNKFPPVVRQALADSEEILTVISDEVDNKLDGQIFYPS